MAHRTHRRQHLIRAHQLDLESRTGEWLVTANSPRFAGSLRFAHFGDAVRYRDAQNAQHPETHLLCRNHCGGWCVVISRDGIIKAPWLVPLRAIVADVTARGFEE